MNEKEINLIQQILLAEVKIQKIRCREMELMNRLQQSGITVGYTDQGVISAWTSDGRYYDLSESLQLSRGNADFQFMKASLMQLLRAETELERLLTGAESAAEGANDASGSFRDPRQENL